MIRSDNRLRQIGVGSADRMPRVRRHHAAVEAGERLEKENVERAVHVEEDPVHPLQGIVIVIRAAFTRQHGPVGAATLHRLSPGDRQCGFLRRHALAAAMHEKRREKEGRQRDGKPARRTL